MSPPLGILGVNCQCMIVIFQVDKLESLSPIMSSLVADLAAEDTPQLYAACGRGPQSSLRVLRHGLEVHVNYCYCRLALITEYLTF